MKHGKLDHCWGCGNVTPFLCARCHKPVCVVMFSPTPDVGCGRLRRVRGQVGVFRLVHYPRCVGRRAPHVLAVVQKGKKTREPSDEELRERLRAEGPSSGWSDDQ